jgi:hypothetical protein
LIVASKEREHDATIVMCPPEGSSKKNTSAS